MRTRFIYAIVCAFVLVGVDLLVNLLAAAIQQRAFSDQFSVSSVRWLVGLIVVGVLAGCWLGGKVQVPASARSGGATTAVNSKMVRATRLRALISYIRLRGRGMDLSDILLIGSRFDIDTRD